MKKKKRKKTYGNEKEEVTSRVREVRLSPEALQHLQVKTHPRRLRWERMSSHRSEESVSRRRSWRPCF